MNASTVKTPQKRIETPPITQLGIIAYGRNNLYPQEIKELVANSESASTCYDRYTSFIQGNGFKNIPFAETVLNTLGETADDLLQLITSDVADWKGLALHINYNLLAQIVEINHIPFENCRLCEPDQTGYISHIAVHPDWTGKTKRAGKTLRVEKKNIDYIPIFNPQKEVVHAQIQKAGGIENYKGQILWISSEGKQTYPKPVHDSVVTQMSTEDGLSNIANRNTRNNFFPFGALITRKGSDTPENEEQPYTYPPYENQSITQSFAKMQGDMNTGKGLHIEIEHDEEKPEFLKIQGNNYDKDFTVTTQTAAAKIYGAFNQEIFYRIMTGSIGFSSQIIKEAYEYYSTVTSKERRMIERAFDKIFKHWKEQINPTSDFTIQPLKYISSETPNN